MSSLSMGDFISPSGSCLSPMDESGLRVSHEHTDSGLGADQDYAYSSERYLMPDALRHKYINQIFLFAISFWADYL